MDLAHPWGFARRARDWCYDHTHWVRWTSVVFASLAVVSNLSRV
jgi:hypothetical protein